MLIQWSKQLKQSDFRLDIKEANLLQSNFFKVTKAIKASGTNVTLRIERIAENYTMKSAEGSSEKAENKIPNGETSEEDSSHMDQDTFVIVEAPKKETDKKNKLLGMFQKRVVQLLLKRNFQVWIRTNLRINFREREAVQRTCRN